MLLTHTYTTSVTLLYAVAQKQHTSSLPACDTVNMTSIKKEQKICMCKTEFLPRGIYSIFEENTIILDASFYIIFAFVYFIHIWIVLTCRSLYTHYFYRKQQKKKNLLKINWEVCMYVEFRFATDSLVSRSF